MIVKKLFPVLFIYCLLWSGDIFAQYSVIYEDTDPDETSICAWAKVDLAKSPGQHAQRIGSVYYTEEVQHLGREAFVRGENQNYVWIKAGDGSEGWINDEYLVKGGGTVVVLSDAPVYEKLKTPHSVTPHFFRAGEIAILTEFSDGWVKLTGQEKSKMGWIEGYSNLSVEDYDIEAAALLAEAFSLDDAENRRNEIRKIRNGRSYVSDEMKRVLDQAFNRTYGNTSEDVFDPNDPYYVDDVPFYTNDSGEDEFAKDSYPIDDLSSGGGSFNDDLGIGSAGSSNRFGFFEREVVDMESGQSYIRVTERGSIQPVKAKRPKSIYYAYHKSLPIGSTVLLEVPGTGKYIQLEIVARLKSNNKHMIGLGSEVIKAVYGETQAKNVPSASISYPKL